MPLRTSSPTAWLFIAAALPLTTLSPLAAAPVINEIHYNNNDNAVADEFIELINPDGVAIDISGWRLTGGINFTFPAATSIPAGEFLVVAENPATLLAEFGATALGPYSGGLSGSGERINLVDTSNALIDRVDYGVDFPWPTAADGSGSSMELINPALDNDLGSSWRSSSVGFGGGPPTYIAAEEQWRYRRGTSEASTPVGDWRQLAFVEDGTWLDGQTSIGRGDSDDNTNLVDMQNNYASVFLRKTFTIAGEIPPTLTLRLYYDDGAIVWLNGTEIARTPSVGAGAIDHRGNAPGDDPLDTGGSVGSHEANGFENFPIADTAALLVPGDNLLAVQMFNSSISSSDSSIDAELLPPPPFIAFSPPTPGATNSIASAVAAPNIRQVDHLPAQPTDSAPVVITARITDPEGVGSVELQYNLIAPGAYVPAFIAKTTSELTADPNGDRSPNPAYQVGWIGVPMVDDGNGDDALAGDSTYTATLAAQPNRTLVRYRIRVTDTPGTAITVPYTDDDALNFAYFVYNGVPDFVAGTRSVTGTVPTTHTAATLTTLPGYHLLTTQTDFSHCVAYNGSDRIPSNNSDARSAFNWSGTFVYNGRVYDNMKYRLRQRNDRYGGSGKRSFRFRFNRGSHVQFHDRNGEAYPTKWRSLNSHKMSARGGHNFGLHEGMNSTLWNLTGTPAPHSHWFHFRVIKGADEAPAGTNGQHLGDFYGLLIAMEDYDSRFLDSHDLEPGNLYKLKTLGNDGLSIQRYQAPGAVTDASDFTNIINQLRPTQSDTWLRDHVNWDSWYHYHAIVDAVRHYDVSSGTTTNNGEHLKNRTYYFQPDPNNPLGKLNVLPWDSDTSWGPNWNGGWDWPKNAMSNKLEFNKEYKNVVREIRDLIWQDDQINGLLDHLEDKLSAFSLADRDRWTGGTGSPNPGQQTDGPIANRLTQMRNFAFTGGSWSGGNDGMRDYIFTAPGVLTSSSTMSRDSGLSGASGRDAYLDALAADPDIPDTPTLTDLSTPGHPTNMLQFESTAFSDGSGAFATMEYRIAEVADAVGGLVAPILEWTATWESGELNAFTAQIIPPASAVRGGLTYRARVRHQDDTGRWSHWSAPIEFTTSDPDITILQTSLVISEIMYNPAGGGDHEYIELKNIGLTPLDLTDVRFTRGIDFDFAPGTTLAPGAYLLVVKNAAASDTQYGSGKPVAGEYQFASIRLTLGTFIIHEFIYDDKLPWPTAADGDGYSLVLIRTSDNAANDPLDPLGHGVAANWRLSATTGGSSGESDSSPFTGAPEADDDADGLSAFLEHALGSADNSPTPAASVYTIGIDGDAMTLTFQRNLSADDAAYAIDISTDLITWTVGATSLSNETPNGDGTSTVTYTSDAIIPDNDRLFMRLRVESVTPLP